MKKDEYQQRKICALENIGNQLNDYNYLQALVLREAITEENSKDCLESLINDYESRLRC